MNSENSDRAPLELPINLTICGVGGCGKKLVGDICKQEWFLEHYSQIGKRLHVYTIDTDANEKDHDERQREKILQTVESLKGRGNIEYKTLYLPGLANINRVSDLASEGIATKIKERKSEPKATVWWLNDNGNKGLPFDELMKIDPDLIDDFSGGVHRRRAISKAVFYKVINERQANGFPTFSNTGTTAIVVGIGGGTGSGMFIDLARYIRGQRGETAQIWLFVVLPTTSEGEKERLNAAIALTELEYLNLNQTERLFNYIVLTSLNPTEYKKGQEAREEVREFDAAFPYIFTNFFHAEKGDMNIADAKKPYSAFVHANAHIITYPIEEIKKFKEYYEAIITEMEGITTNRKNLNQIVGDLLDKIGQATGANPTRDDFDYIKKEFGNIEKSWKNSIGKLLNYQTIEAIEYLIDNVPAEICLDRVRTYDGLVDFISRVRNFAREVKEDELKDDIDRKLFRLLPESLQALETTAQNIKRIAAVDDESMRLALMGIMRGQENINVCISDLNARKRETQGSIEKLEATIETKKNDLAILNDRKEQIYQSVDRTLSDIDIILDQYATLTGKIRRVQDPEKSLKVAIDKYLDGFRAKKIKASNREAWLRTAEVADLQKNITDISYEINEDLDGLANLIEAIGLYYYYDMRIKKIESGGIGSRIIGYINNRPNRDRNRFEALKREREEYIKANARYWDIRINAPFELHIPDRLLSKNLNIRADDLRREIADTVFRDVPKDDLEGISDLFESGDRGQIRSALRERLTDIILHRENFDQISADFEQTIADLKAQVEKENVYSNALGKVESAAEASSPYRKDINTRYRKFFETLVQTNEQKAYEGKTKVGKYRTKFGEINPQILSLIGEDSSLHDLDWDDNGQRELDKLAETIIVTSNKLIDSSNLGVNHLDTQTGTSKSERWNFKTAGLMISSQSKYLSQALVSNQIEDIITDSINQSLSLKEKDDVHLATHNHAKPWEVGLTFFAAADYLENIEPLVAGRGYWEEYKKNKDNILHHVLLMNSGQYIIRNDLLAPGKAGDLSNQEKDGVKVSEKILELYSVKGIREALSR